MTSQLTDVYMPFAGAFKVKLAPGEKLEPLIHASENSKLVPTFEAEPQSADQLRKDFVPSRDKDFYYAARLTGNFKTAFPHGDPNAKEEEKKDAGAAAKPAEAPPAKTEAVTKPIEIQPAKPAPAPTPKPDASPKPAPAPSPKVDASPKPAGAPAPKPDAAPAKKEAGGEGAPESKEPAKKDDSGKKQPAKPASLKESIKTGTVVVVSDVDFIYDRFAVQILNLGPGMRAAQPINQNLSFAQNLVEALGGDQRLISVRSRQSTRRPFTTLNKMQAKAQAVMRARIEALESKEKEIGQKLQAALKVEETEGGHQQIIIDQSKIDKGAIEAMRKEQVDARKDLRDARKELKRKQDFFINVLKVVNIGLMPVLIIALGIFLFQRRQKGLEAR